MLAGPVATRRKPRETGASRIRGGNMQGFVGMAAAARLEPYREF
jgi:hypothetical protein